MKKLMINLSTRQDIILRDLSEETDLPLAEIIRRALDDYVDKLVKNKTLIRYRFCCGDKSVVLEASKNKFKELYETIKNNPGALTIEEDTCQ
jgi:predicted transcriptional regulator